MPAAGRRATSLLLVDDDEAFRERMGRALRQRGFEVWVAGDLLSAVAVVTTHPCDLAVVDLRMPDASGHDVVDAIVARSPATKVVVLTGYGSIASAVEALHRGALQYLSKPLDADELAAALDKVQGAGDEEAASTSGGRLTARPEGTPSLARAEWEHIQRVLADARGNVSEAARRLGIARRTLQLKLKKYPPRA